MINRRELMKFFGAGATITPLVAGEPIYRATARLIEIPHIEIVSPNEADMPRLWADRLTSNPFERLWLARWRKEQANYSILEHLLDRSPTEDERAVVAGLMQWFGTNCGLGFLHGTFRAEGYYLASSDQFKNDRLRHLYYAHSAQWPEFITLRMKDGPPEII